MCVGHDLDVPFPDLTTLVVPVIESSLTRLAVYRHDASVVDDLSGLYYSECKLSAAVLHSTLRSLAQMPLSGCESKCSPEPELRTLIKTFGKLRLQAAGI